MLPVIFSDVKTYKKKFKTETLGMPLSIRDAVHKLGETIIDIFKGGL